MQTFSNMRRNSINHIALNPTYILFAIAIVYGSVSSIFYYLTPLIGLSFYFLAEHFEDEDYYVPNLLILIYVSYVEINRGLFLFSFFVFFLLFYRLSIRLIRESIHCKWCQPLLYITVGYFGYYLFNLFLAHIFNLETYSIGWGYIVFILTDIMLALILL